MTRRHVLWAGALGAVGLSLPQLLRAETQGRQRNERSIILVVPWGGPAQLDTFDLKPDAPSEVRSPFRPIATRTPGLSISEHLPRLAALSDRYAVIRSATHGVSTHNPATHYALTGYPPAIANVELTTARRTDQPAIGSVLAKLRPSAGSLPSYVQLPLPMIDNGAFSNGQNAGFLGTAFDPLVVSKDPNKPNFQVPASTLPAEINADRLDGRRDLLHQLDAHAEHWSSTAAVQNMGGYYQKAYQLLRSAASKQAFDVALEPAPTRDRYGRTTLGQSLLVARRLVEAGVRLVMVADTRPNTNDRWDTHGGNYPVIAAQLRETDAALSALLEDLHARGLLSSTIVLWMAEFGRTPKARNNGGRDHWPHCYSLLLAGGGIQGGRAHGSSDSMAAYPREQPVRPEDLHATLYHLLGIPLHTEIHDVVGRPVRICTGTPIRSLL
jgi:hypothetical protein